MQVVLVMEYAPNGDLFTKLERAHREQAALYFHPAAENAAARTPSARGLPRLPAFALVRRRGGGAAAGTWGGRRVGIVAL